MKFFSAKPELDATKMPTPIDIAWSAGIYEGEGHIRNRKSISAIVSVTQKDTEILYRLRDWFGGSVRLASCKTVPEDRQCHAWQTCGDRARLFIALAYPFLSGRRKAQVDATRALEFLGGNSSSGLSYQQVKTLLSERAAKYISDNPARVRQTAQQRQRRLQKRLAVAASTVHSVTQERVM